MKSTVGASQLDTALVALSNPYRRQLLLALLISNPQDDSDTDPLGVLADHADDEELESLLLHVHLPKLEAAEVIEWNRETGDISTGPEWDTIAPLLQLIHDNRDELPDGYL
jgi:hypothetical protein